MHVRHLLTKEASRGLSCNSPGGRNTIYCQGGAPKQKEGWRGVWGGPRGGKKDKQEENFPQKRQEEKRNLGAEEGSTAAREKKKDFQEKAKFSEERTGDGESNIEKEKAGAIPKEARKKTPVPVKEAEEGRLNKGKGT